MGGGNTGRLGAQVNWGQIVVVGYGVLVGWCAGFALGVTLGLYALAQFKRDIHAAMERHGLTENDADL